MGSLRRWMGAMVLCLVAGGLFGQERANAVKIGLENNGFAFLMPQVSFEKTLKGHASLQLDLGLGVNDWQAGAGRHWEYTAQMVAGARFYLALRRRQLLSGFYLGPYLDLGRKWIRPRGDNYSRFEMQAFAGGLCLGYQHAFFDRLRLDGGIKAGTLIDHYYRAYQADGSLVSSRKQDGFWVGMYLRVGYAF